ncbi:YebC/PmpR family DNA-binding transcriptional regulator [Persicitalea jodogahamensis]|uniref:Probable transcriptional regulatory protein GCM10007390_24800 n=1 Tax=Persicitalea jodogahamensis TaxID=402147 RepID=A0A8J3D427_9BACT|nr:YebC/PmpR family DNA-binding transcriptional regulator [Persicitalea jodogahamensis]GHB70219.1 putative transcriptional regulatory protein [Persicitalea jodogahamensis]
MGRAFEYRKARMFKRWDHMAKTFTRIGKDITLAVKEGTDDPATNARLRVLIQNARAANMPKDTVDRAIKRASERDQADYKEMVYEGYGPHGIAILVESTTDNPTRTVANVRSYFNKLGGSLGTMGMLDFLFDRKCIFKIANSGQDVEELELELIDYGAEEVFLDEETDQINVYGEFTSFGSLQSYFEENNIEIAEADFERIPKDTKKLSEEETAEVEKLIERIEEDDDVQRVYHTMG